uniref:Tumor necrosis factor, alpha-induced protein 2b n=1 Tax=Lates calcarifer TaxID=8187 RepID=A0A4W6FXG9_LATCA
MRTRSDSSEPDGTRPNFLPGLTARASGGNWFRGKLPRLFRRSLNVLFYYKPHLPQFETRPPLFFSLSVILTFEENLGLHKYSEASQLLIQREESLFGEITELDSLARHEEEVNDLAEDYGILKRNILQTLLQSLKADANTEALTSAVKAIYQEDKQDGLWRQTDRTRPGWRPNSWRELHDATLHNLVNERMDYPSTPSANQEGQSSVEAHIHSMGRQLKDDLLMVVEVVRNCYPPETDICNVYARLYHQTFSARLRKVADFGLEDKDCQFLLRWVNEYYPGSVFHCELTWLLWFIYRDTLTKNGDLFLEDVRKDCLSVLTDMKESAHMYLLSPVHEVLKVRLFTRDMGELMSKFHQEVTVEYVKRLLRGEVKLKDKERQDKAYVTVKNDAERLHSLFIKMGSKEDWLKEILIKIAEVLKLQELPAIQMQVASLGSAFPDLRFFFSQTPVSKTGFGI